MPATTSTTTIHIMRSRDMFLLLVCVTTNASIAFDQILPALRPIRQAQGWQAPDKRQHGTLPSCVFRFSRSARKTEHLENTTLSISILAQRLDRVEPRRAAGRRDAEEQADRHRKSQREHDRFRRNHGLHNPGEAHALGDRRAQHDPYQPARQAQAERLDQKLELASGTFCGLAIASASAVVSVWPLPTCPPTPPVLGAPGRTVSKFAPLAVIAAVIEACEPLPLASSATTAATPMITPSAVSSERSLLDTRLPKAIRRLSLGLIPPRCRSASAASSISTSSSAAVAGASVVGWLVIIAELLIDVFANVAPGPRGRLFVAWPAAHAA